MLGLPDDFFKSQGLNQLWMKDNGDSVTNNNGFTARQSYILTPKRSFNFKIPLEHIFGFCEDYKKIIYGLRQSLTLVRKSDDDAIYRTAAVDEGKVTLSKNSWLMPHVLSADQQKFELYKTIEERVQLPVAYRMRQCDSITVPQSTNFTWRHSVKTSHEKPRDIIIGFQTDRDAQQVKKSII